MPLRSTAAAAVLTLVGALSVSSSAAAQYPPAPGAYPPQPPGYGPPPANYPPPQRARRPISTGLEMGTLYATSVAWGIGTGIWIDAEAEVTDPGLALLAPAILGTVAPLAVFAVDRLAYRKGMPEGLPSAVATGLIVGAGEGLGVAGLQWVSADADSEWGFRGLARAEVIGSTLGAGAGFALHYFLEPAPETNILIASSTFWGTSIGSFFGGGATEAFSSWGDANDGVALGGLIGFNVAVAGAVGSSAFWTPSWNQLGWMWGGFGIGTAIASPVYIFYAGSEHDPRRGLIFQGVAGTIGLGLGAILGEPRRRSRVASQEKTTIDDSPIQLWGGGPMALNGGLGLQLMGGLW